MLRVSNSVHEPLHSPRTQKSPNAEVLRKQIVGMINEDDQGKENKQPMKNHIPIIYQIQRKGGTGTILKPSDKSERQKEKVKQSHLKFICESNIGRSKTFPSIEDYVLHGESKDTSRSYDFEDPAKRHWGLPGDLKQEKSKNVRFRIHEETKTKQIHDESGQNEKELQRPLTYCEVRGNAILSFDKIGRLSKPSIRQRRAEAAKRQATIHTSLQLFKRRLKLNQETYITPSVNNNHDNDYIIRRVPLKISTNANIPVPRVPSAAKPVIEQILSVNTTQRPKSSAGHCLNVEKSFVKERPQSSPERHLLKPRIKENMHASEIILFQEDEEQEATATLVNTYFVEPNKPKPNQFHQSSLSMHNIDVHNSLNGCSDARMRLVNTNKQLDNRFLRWLEESSANSQEARRAAMKTHHDQFPQIEPPKSPLFPTDHNNTEL